MSPPRIELASPLAEPIRQFLAAKRALNRRFDTEERTLRLLDRHLAERGIVQLVDVTSAVIEAFLTADHAGIHAATIICSECCGGYSIGWSIRDCSALHQSGCGRAG